MSTSTVAIDHEQDRSYEGEDHAGEVARGERFEFGKNWAHFLGVLDESRIAEAERSLRGMLELDNLHGRRFLDIGSGSGLFSLAARRLGARVHSFDYDPQSVECTRALKARFHPQDESWTVERGSALDRPYLESLGRFDIVYSWGVLHHTGSMWQALENAHERVAPGGRLFIALYNDCGSKSRRWKGIKATYSKLPPIFRTPFAVVVSAPEELKGMARAVLSGRPQDYIHSWTQYDRSRGMSRWHDIIDWVGGHPYEYAKPDAIFSFFRKRGFALESLKVGGGLGCSEYVFVRGS